MKLPFFHAKMLALIRLNNYLWRTIILKNGQQSKKTMEDVMQFLLVAGILAFGIFRQFNKEKNKKSEKGNSMPAPEYEYEPEFEEPMLLRHHPKQTKKRKLAKMIFPFVRQKRQGVPSSGRKYFEENINIDILTRKIYDFYGT